MIDWVFRCHYNPRFYFNFISKSLLCSDTIYSGKEHYTSNVAYLASSIINCRLGGTLLLINVVVTSSASTVSLIEICARILVSGSSVVSQSWLHPFRQDLCNVGYLGSCYLYSYGIFSNSKSLKIYSECIFLLRLFLPFSALSLSLTGSFLFS